MKNPQSMFFKKMIEKKGPNFLEAANAEEIRKFSNLLFKDILFGSINKQKQGYIFFDKRFMDIIMNIAYTNMCQYSIQLEALNHYANICPYANNNYFQLTYNKNMKLSMIYNGLYQALVYISQSGDLSILDYLAVNLKNVRYEL